MREPDEKTKDMIDGLIADLKRARKWRSLVKVAVGSMARFGGAVAGLIALVIAESDDL